MLIVSRNLPYWHPYSHNIKAEVTTIHPSAAPSEVKLGVSFQRKTLKLVTLDIK